MIRLTCWLVVSLLLLVSHAAEAAGIVTIDFEELRVETDLIRSVGSVYSHDGFSFTASLPPEVGDNPRFNTIGTLSTSFYGSTPLYNGISNSLTRLTRTDGGLFHLMSIDLAELPNFHEGGWPPVDLGSFTLTFFGTRRDGSIVQSTATIGAFPAATTWTFNPDFHNLTSVEWLQGPGSAEISGRQTHQFDNVRLVAVPEPGTLILLAAGLLTMRLRYRPE